MTQQEFLAIAKRFTGRGEAGSEPPSAHSRLHDEGRKAIWLGNLIIFAGLGLFFAWAIIAPLGEGVTAPGRVVVESMRKTVTHSSGGTIETIHVVENQFVKAGDLLVSLKADKAKSAYETMLQEYIATAAKLARLHAEQEGANDIEFPEDLYNLAEENARLETLKAQRDLFLIRRQAMNSEQAILRENIAATSAQIDGLVGQIHAKTEQLRLLRQEAESMGPLVESGYTSRNSSLDLARRIAEMSASKTELETRVARESSTSAELRLRLLQRRQEFMREVETQIAEARTDVLKFQGQLSDARVDLESKKIRAPTSGQVVALQTHTVDAAINPGTRILDIIPENEALLIDIEIPVQNIGSVHAGESADVRITAFAGQAQLVIGGKILSVSSDVHEAQAPKLPFYLARVAVTPEGMAQLGRNQLRPGMSVDVVLKTGERSLLAYLMRPLMKQMFYALKEQ